MITGSRFLTEARPAGLRRKILLEWGGSCTFLFEKAPLWKIRLKNKSSTAHTSYGNMLASLKAGTGSFIIWLNKNYGTRINPHHCAPPTICEYG